MRVLSKMILTTMVLVSFSSMAKTKAKTATLLNDKVDQLVMSLDLVRIQAENGMDVHEGGFAVYVLEKSKEFLSQNQDTTAAHIDARMRKWHSPIRLLAVDRRFFPDDKNSGATSCLIPISGQTQEPQFGLSVVVGDAQMIRNVAFQYGIKSEKQNAENLKSVGILEPCVGI